MAERTGNGIKTYKGQYCYAIKILFSSNHRNTSICWCNPSLSWNFKIVRILPHIHIWIIFIRNHDETQLGLSGSTSKECGVEGPAFLTYFFLMCQGINACKAIGVKTAAAAVKNNFFHRKHNELNEDRSISFYNNKIACVAWRYTGYKAAKKTSGEIFAARLNRQVVRATDHRETPRNRFLFGSKNVTKHSCDVIQ